MQKIKNNLLYIIIILFPIIDIITSFCIRYTSLSITPSLITRGVFLILCVMYTINKKELKYRKANIIFYIISFIYFIIYMGVRISYLNINSIIYEVSSFFKFWYYPVILLFLINVIVSKKIDTAKIMKSLDINLLIYSLGIIIPKLTNTAFSSYQNGKAGVIGWFYAANEIGAIISILFGIQFLDIRKEENYLKKYILTILAIISLSLIGTKVVTFSLIIIVAIALIISLLKNKFNIKSKNLIFTIIVFIISLLVVFNSSTINNVFNRIPINISQNNNSNNKPHTNITGSSSKPKEKKTFISTVLSGRDKFLKNTYEEYKKAPLTNKLIGLGFVNKNNETNKLIEMDIFDIIFCYGIIGLLILIVPIIVIIFIIMKNMIKNKIISHDIIMCILLIGLTIGVSTLAGHVLGAPAASLYLAILIAILYLLSSKEREKESI